MENIHIYHTNDLHSHFDHWPRIRHLLQERQRWHKEAGDEVFLFDIGDHMDRWHPFTEGTHGKGNTQLLNQAGYTAVTIGNNEGITLPHEDLDSVYQDAQFDVLLGNLFYKNGERPGWAKPYTIYTTKKGTRIGVFGLTVYFNLFYDLLGWKLEEPLQELQNILPELKEKADIIIFLSHLGLHEDERIAADYPDIDIILGGHTHHILHEGKMVNETLLCGAGKHGAFVGHVELNVSSIGLTANKKAILYDVNEIEAPVGETEEASNLFENGKHLLGEKIVTLEQPLKSEYFKPSQLPQLLCEALREWCDADCAFLNAGLLLGPISGDVTKYDLLTVCPHPINPCVVELPGNELREILLQTRDEEWPHMQIKGLGFRGKVMGNMVYDQIEFIDELQEIRIKGRNLKPNTIYKLAIPDMFTFGRFFPVIQRSAHKRYFMPEFLRDLLAWKLTK
ncbi:bifunctional metallophosphatase/5'-nucleotidase [Neobacillus terrae]|uniref:bifunctional metallophosphatase/5'-nucleotidase n=1 Tax=Neobacillus terrae TaxID=3034837 RepID=UPI00140C1CCF|nr:bifunctional UDP-sugar hydrolase/5'-nucleotidase [Neobacillus terrae]NHM32783.1 bifunctional metallophosphatase/5'-nucleotidase [Neobacillus terrae]